MAGRCHRLPLTVVLLIQGKKGLGLQRGDISALGINHDADLFYRCDDPVNYFTRGGCGAEV